MGADFIWAIAPIDESKETVISKVKEMTLHEARDLYSRAEHTFPDFTDEELFPDFTDEKNDELFRQAIIARAVEAIETCYGNNRDISRLALKNSQYVLTGGMSWGDAPTNAFDDVCLLWEIDQLFAKRAESTAPKSPRKCPVCGSEDYDCEDEQWEEDTYYVYMYCRESSCHGRWTEVYVFESFTIEENEPKDNFD